jgi:parallel beta-helix repeat protein
MLWGIVAVLGLNMGAGGCLYTEQAKVMPPMTIPFGGEYRVSQTLRDHPPQTVAVLPFQNKTDKKEAFDIVRQSFHGHFSKLNYTAIPLFKVDHALRQAGLDTPGKVVAAPSQKLREILQVDAIIRGQVTHYDRIYAAVYSQVAVGAEVQMIEAKTGKELWWCKEVSRKHGGGLSTTPVGFILTAVTTALNMREIELLRSSDDLFRDMIKTIPQPTLAQALRPPNITILVHDGMRRTDRYALRAGDILKVAMEGDPGKKALFKIGDFKKDIPLREEDPGTYTGSYKILPGDYVTEALIAGTLTDDHGTSTEWVDALGPVTIDTIPPQVPGGLKVTGRDRAAELSWTEGSDKDKDIARYKIYRSSTPLTGYHEVGSTELTAFQDRDLRNGTSYYYKVSAVDLAGNESRLSQLMRATPVTPGPTLVKGIITGETTWFAGASPYVIEGEVLVDTRGTLTIEPSSVIQSRGGGIAVSGKLIARGDERSMITFAAASPEEVWKGIVFNGTKNEESAVEYAKITGAAAGITCLSSSPLITNNDLSKNQVGLRIREPFSRPKIQGNVISGNTLSGVEISDGAAPLLQENEIRGNQKDGITSREANPSILKNRILNNGGAGLRFLSSSGRLSNNNIHDNGEYEIFNSLENDMPVEANDNWWGTREAPEVVDRIYGRVQYQRILDAPFPQGKSMELSILKGPLAGPVSQDSFLILGNSPYVVEKEVIVDGGATLFIQPGVSLKFSSGASILVKKGGIDARGTRDGWITFTANSPSPSPGSYPAAIRFEQSSPVASFLRYCIVEFAETGLEVAYGAPDIDHCLITQNSQAGMKVSQEGAPKVFFSTFTKNAGTGAVVALGASRPKIHRSNFAENPFAIQNLSSIYLDARENWWGEATPCESIFLGEINRKPWLERPEPEAFLGRKP